MTIKEKKKLRTVRDHKLIGEPSFIVFKSQAIIRPSIEWITVMGVAFGLPAESYYDSFFLVNSFISADIILYPLIHYFLIIFAFFFD